jgi:hypothetical protein
MTIVVGSAPSITAASIINLTLKMAGVLGVG